MSLTAKYYEDVADSMTGTDQEAGYRKAQDYLNSKSESYIDDWNRIQNKIVLNLEVQIKTEKMKFKKPCEELTHETEPYNWAKESGDIDYSIEDEKKARREG